MQEKNVLQYQPYNLFSTNSMEAFEWEERHHSTPFYLHMLAGSIAGISEHLSMLPIDNIKTHCQAGSQYTIKNIIKKIYNIGGLKNFYSGSSVVAFGCAPAHAIYFSIYQKSKEILECNPETDNFKFAVVGAVSSFFHDAIMTPTQTIKQRLQLMRGELGGISTMDVMRNVYRSEGVMAFYRSFPINYFMNVPFGSFMILINEKCKHIFGVKEGDHHLNYYLCGGVAGGIASIPTCPFDVIKTKLNTQNCLTGSCQKMQMCNALKDKVDKISTVPDQYEFKSARGKMFRSSTNSMSTSRTNSVKYRNFFDTTGTIWKEEGLKGFFIGVKMRIVIQSLSSAMAWGTYQIIKSLIFPSTLGKE